LNELLPAFAFAISQKPNQRGQLPAKVKAKSSFCVDYFEKQGGTAFIGFWITKLPTYHWSWKNGSFFLSPLVNFAVRHTSLLESAIATCDNPIREILYYRLNHSIWSSSDNKESSR
jgi:hypothetical protein